MRRSVALLCLCDSNTGDRGNSWQTTESGFLVTVHRQKTDTGRYPNMAHHSLSLKPSAIAVPVASDMFCPDPFKTPQCPYSSCVYCIRAISHHAFVNTLLKPSISPALEDINPPPVFCRRLRTTSAPRLYEEKRHSSSGDRCLIFNSWTSNIKQLLRSLPCGSEDIKCDVTETLSAYRNKLVGFAMSSVLLIRETHYRAWRRFAVKRKSGTESVTVPPWLRAESSPYCMT